MDILKMFFAAILLAVVLAGLYVLWKRQGKEEQQRTLKKLLVDSKGTIVTYFAFFVGVLFIYHTLSDGDFSFLLTLGSICRSFGFGIVAAKMWMKKSTEGISAKTLILYGVVFSSRLMSILMYEG